MSDEQIRQVKLFLQLAEEVQDLRLNGHIERRHGLVANNQLGIDRQGARDSDALPLPAAELVRIAIDVFDAKAHQTQQMQDMSAFSVPSLLQFMHFQGTAENLHDGLTRVQRAIGILEHELDSFP